MRKVLVATMMCALVSSVAEARVVRLRIERREVILNGRAFGAAGPYEKLVGKVDFGLDPALPAQRRDRRPEAGAAQRARRGRGERRLLHAEAGRPAARQRPAVLRGRQPRRQGDALDLPEGDRITRSDDRQPSSATARSCARASRCSGWDGSGTCPNARARCAWRCRSPPRTAQRITGLVRGNFILNERATTASVADRTHKAYPVARSEQRRERDDGARRSDRQRPADPALALALRRRAAPSRSTAASSRAASTTSSIAAPTLASSASACPARAI